MKTFLPLLLVVAMLVGCSDEPTTPADTNTSSTNSFNVTGNGYSNAAFKGYNADSASQATVDGSNHGIIAFTGKGSKTNEVFAISLMVPEGKTGKITIDPNPSNYATFILITSDGTTNAQYMALSGEIDVKTWDATAGGAVKGTFSGTAALATAPGTTITISEGKFDTKRQ